MPATAPSSFDSSAALLNAENSLAPGADLAIQMEPSIIILTSFIMAAASGGTCPDRCRRRDRRRLRRRIEQDHLFRADIGDRRDRLAIHFEVRTRLLPLDT